MIEDGLNKEIISHLDSKNNMLKGEFNNYENIVLGLWKKRIQYSEINILTANIGTSDSTLI